MIKNIILSTFILFSTVGFAFAQPNMITKVKMPTEILEVAHKTKSDSDIEDLVWNRWTSKNFVVLCLNDLQAKYLHDHLELVKSWIFSRWGMYDIDFSKECRVICVDDPALFKKFFGLTESKFEKRKDIDVLFLLVDDSPSKTIPIPLSKACLSEFAENYKTNFPWWAYVGMSELNGSISQIKQSMIEINNSIKSNNPMFFSEGLMEMTEVEYRKLSPEKRAIFDRNAAAFCLMIRKEFGQNKFLLFLKECSDGNSKVALKNVLGFDSQNEFDGSFKRYMADLSQDCLLGKTPDSYLQIKPRIED